MVDSVSGNAPGLATSMMNKITTDEKIDVAIVKKGQDIQKAEGESMLKLIDAAAPIQPGGLNVTA